VTVTSPAGGDVFKLKAIAPATGLWLDSDESGASTAYVAPPVITSATGTTFTIGTTGSFIVTADNSPISFAQGGDALPNDVSFDTTSGVLSGTPAAGTDGTYNLTFTATNAGGTSTPQNFTLTVNTNMGIDNPQKSGAKVYTLPGLVVVEGNESRTISIYTLTGVLYTKIGTPKGTSKDKTTIPLPKGIYVVVIGEKKIKVVIN
jgi:hypothetical protein